MGVDSLPTPNSEQHSPLQNQMQLLPVDDDSLAITTPIDWWVYSLGLTKNTNTN